MNILPLGIRPPQYRYLHQALRLSFVRALSFSNVSAMAAPIHVQAGHHLKKSLNLPLSFLVRGNVAHPA
jgi:hypothetical protein